MHESYVSFQYPFEAVKQNICRKIAKISPKISIIHEKPPNKQKTHMNFQKPSNNCQIHPKIKAKSQQNLLTEKKEKNAIKCRTLTKNFARLELFFTPQFLAL